MKYIKTKDGHLYKVKKENLYDFVCEDNFGVMEGLNIHKSIVLKQANNIKDLCDAYIITSKQGHIYDSYGDYGYELKEVLPQAREEWPDEDWDLYGCILVNGIIKQVAKLNDDKGELELL